MCGSWCAARSNSCSRANRTRPSCAISRWRRSRAISRSTRWRWDTDVRDFLTRPARPRLTSRLHRSMGSVAWLFPGQGSQTVGMSRELAERYPTAMHTFDEASHARAIDVKALAWDGPQTELDRTANTQPALLTASIAALRAAQEAGAVAEPLVLLGHSLGEF